MIGPAMLAAAAMDALPDLRRMTAIVRAAIVVPVGW